MSDTSRPRSYSVYGLVLQTDLDFADILPLSPKPADLVYRVSQSPDTWAQAEMVFDSPYLLPDGSPHLQIWRRGDALRVRLPQLATYDLTPTSIVCYPRLGVSETTLQLNLLADGLALWLELRGCLTLHASAVVVEGGAVGWLSHSGNGKSTLAATFVQAGYPLLTDDILPVETRGDLFSARPGYPRMRLWENEAQHFLGHYADLAKVHPAIVKRWVPIGADGMGTFCDAAQPLRCLYVPERRAPTDANAEIEIAPVSARDAVIDLIRYSFESYVVEALGLQARRLDLFARLARQIPVRRLSYPSGLPYLAQVRAAILDDLRNLGSR